LLRGYDIRVLNDFSQLDEIFEIYSRIASNNLKHECDILGKTLNSKYVHDVLSSDKSAEMKRNYIAPKRSDEEFLAFP